MKSPRAPSAVGDLGAEPPDYAQSFVKAGELTLICTNNYEEYREIPC